MDAQNLSTAPSTSDRSPATAAVDGIFRRLLRISDPRDAEEVARALLVRYTDEAQKIQRERMGLPFTLYQAQTAAAPPPGGAPRQELTAASTALDAALKDLTTNTKLADIAPELRGWSHTIQNAASEGVTSARQAIDASERDRAFGARRTLGDYARLARYAGALTSCAPDIYCAVARICDDMANLILVMIGDALADAGLTRSRAILQVPAGLLQARRDGVIVALRNLSQPANGDDEESWPRGAKALFDLYDGLDKAGAPDLRALLDEGYLSRQLDDLIDMATGASPDTLRALGSAAITTVQRMQRFLFIAQAVSPPLSSPPAAMFFTQLELFMQGFAGTNVGYRLPYLARSPLLVSSIAASLGIDPPTQRLLNMALKRTALADAIDCLCCLCDQADAVDMVVAGSLLSNLDRAIDFYALGDSPNSNTGPEYRAAIYGALIGAAASLFTNVSLKAQLPTIADLVTNQLMWPAIFNVALPGIIVNPPPVPPPPPPGVTVAQLSAVINVEIDDERRWSELVSSIAPICRQDLLFKGIIDPANPPSDPIGNLISIAVRAIRANGINVQISGLAPLELPRPIATSLDKGTFIT
jgi:hypothetical protein